MMVIDIISANVAITLVKLCKLSGNAGIKHTVSIIMRAYFNDYLRATVNHDDLAVFVLIRGAVLTERELEISNWLA